MSKRYVKIYAGKSRRYQKNHTAKGCHKEYRLECRRVYQHLLRTGGIMSNNSRRVIHHLPLIRKCSLNKIRKY